MSSQLETIAVGARRYLPTESVAVHARVNWSRWIADCGNPACTSALAIPAGCLAMRCWDCGFITGPILWPPDPDGVEALLAMRPDETTRNWAYPETLNDLLAENLAHGIFPPGIDPGSPDRIVLMSTTNERIDGGVMAVELEAYRAAKRLQIGD